MGSLVTIILIACVVYAVKSSKGRMAGQGQPPRPAQNTYRQPNEPRPVQNTYQQPNQPRPPQNTYRQPNQPRPAQNTYQQPNQPHHVRNTYRQPVQPSPAQHINQQPQQEPRPVRQEQVPDEKPEISLDGGIVYMPETVLDKRSELMYQLEELMVMGYQAKLPYERDFLAEGMDMLMSAASNE